MNRIIRKKNENFTIISNVVLRDNRISLKAKGVIALVMSLPPSWDFSIRGLISIVKEGRDSIYTAINELKKFGYCEVVACRDEKGKLLGNDYVFYEEPIAVKAQCDHPHTDFPDMDKPHTENPETEKPDTENPTQINKEDNKEEKINNIPQIKDLFEDVVIPSFDDFYKTYPLKKSKKDAIRAWNKLSDKDKIAATEKVSEYKADCDRCERNYRYPATYLNGRTWEDDFSGSGKQRVNTNLLDNSTNKFENGFSW